MPKSKSKGGKREKPVELGFAEEETDTWKLASPFFASKLGGKPSWLDLKNVPSIAQLKCPSCEGPTRFLLQVYAPLDSEDSFHRVIFIFVCSKQHCCAERNSSKNLVVVSCQIKRENEFYSNDPPKYDIKLAEDIVPQKFGVKICVLCGIIGPQHCGSCKKVNYCSKEHQTVDWKLGHKEECVDADFKSRKTDKYSFKEYEIVIDTEVIPKETSQEKNDKSRLEEFQKLVSEGKAGTLDDTALTKDMLEAASYKSDKAFNKFRKRVAYQPDQILRYDRGGEPLWVAAEGTLKTADIPPCSYCKGARVFEFQIMPQLLNYLGQDSVDGYLDWGTIAVYTCEKSCAEGPTYKAEFAWKQDFKPDSEDSK